MQRRGAPLARDRHRRDVHRLRPVRHADRRADRPEGPVDPARVRRGGSGRPGPPRATSTASTSREIGTVVHGTTIAVNTLIQRTGARLGLLVTEGFRDVLELQRLRLPNPFDLDGARPLPLIPRARVAEVRERLRADGASTRRSTRAACGTRVRRLAGQGVEGLVVSLLHSYRNPAHERRARAIAEAAAPGLPVSVVVRRLAAGARVRADGAGRARRVRAAEGAALPRGLRAGARRARRAGHALRHEVERRHHAGGGGARSRRWRRCSPGRPRA